MLKRLIKRLKKENLQKQLNEIISRIDLKLFNKYLVSEPQNVEIVPVITIIDNSDNDGAFSLGTLTEQNIFRTGKEKLVFLRYGISKEKAKELVNSSFEAQDFSNELVQNMLKTLNSLSDYQIRLSQKIGLNLPGMPNEYVRQTVKGDFEIRAFCKILL